MLTQLKNEVKVEGILSEIDIQPKQFEKNGVNTEALAGTVTIKVNQELYGQEYNMDIPIYVFATKKTNSGNDNPAYKSLENIKNNLISLAACDGNLDKADRIRVTGGNIRENAFYSQQTGQLISQARIHASFFSKIKKEECKPEASFVVNAIVGNIIDEIDKNQEPTGNIKIQGILVQYGGKAEVVEFIVKDEAAITHINSYWKKGDIVKVIGKIIYTSSNVKMEEEVGFGMTIDSFRTETHRELVVIGGSAGALEGEIAYEESDLSAALTKRKADLEKTKNATKTTKAASFNSGISAASSFDGNDLDF